MSDFGSIYQKQIRYPLFKLHGNCFGNTSNIPDCTVADEIGKYVIFSQLQRLNMIYSTFFIFVGRRQCSNLDCRSFSWLLIVIFLLHCVWCRRGSFDSFFAIFALFFLGIIDGNIECDPRVILFLLHRSLFSRWVHSSSSCINFLITRLIKSARHQSWKRAKHGLKIGYVLLNSYGQCYLRSLLLLD